MELMIAEIVHRQFLPAPVVTLVVLVAILIGWGFLFGYLVGRASTVTVLSKLRTALADACNGCIRCHGNGVLQTPGATVRCPNCSRWRGAVEEASR